MTLHNVEEIRNIALCGHGAAGKTTLVRQYFEHHKYFSLEDPDTNAISTSNQWGTYWIQRMALAHCKNMLGLIVVYVDVRG